MDLHRQTASLSPKRGLEESLAAKIISDKTGVEKVFSERGWIERWSSSEMPCFDHMEIPIH
jgi:hypothetical protein